MACGARMGLIELNDRLAHVWTIRLVMELIGLCGNPWSFNKGGQIFCGLYLVYKFGILFLYNKNIFFKCKFIKIKLNFISLLF